MARDSHSDTFTSTRRVLVALGFAGALCAVAVLGIYGWYFQSQSISANTASWGEFGDFVGGLLNPIMGFLAVIGLFWTIYLNQVELALTRDELRNSSRALDQNNRLVALAALKDDLKRVIDTVHRAIDIRMDVELDVNRGGTPRSFCFSEILDSLPRITPICQMWLDQHAGHVADTARLVIQLNQYLREYEKFPDGRLVSNFYKRYHGRLAMLLHIQGAIDRPTLTEMTQVSDVELRTAPPDSPIDFNVYFGAASIPDPVVTEYIAITSPDSLEPTR